MDTHSCWSSKDFAKTLLPSWYIVFPEALYIQQSRRVEQLLDGPYYGQGVVALLAAEEGRHVAPRAMLGFERAVVPADTSSATSFISAS